MSYYVICRVDRKDKGPGKYTLVNKEFDEWDDAQDYCHTISDSREPKVVADLDGIRMTFISGKPRES